MVDATTLTFLEKDREIERLSSILSVVRNRMLEAERQLAESDAAIIAIQDATEIRVPHVPGHLASPCWKYIKEAREREVKLNPGWLRRELRAASILMEEYREAEKRAEQRIAKEDNKDFP